MLVVIDTNILLVCISRKSNYHWLYRLIIDKKIRIAFTTDILNEYYEQISSHWHFEVATDLLRSFTELSTSVFTTSYFNLNLITTDVDDNKFVDCAFAANADFIVTNDNHFNVLKTIYFPTIPILRIDEFKEVLIKNNILS